MITDEDMARLRRSRKEFLGKLLLEDDSQTIIDQTLSDPGIRDFMAGMATAEAPEFIEHQCWRMLFVWPSDDEEGLPGRCECAGCGRVFRIELEYTP